MPTKARQHNRHGSLNIELDGRDIEITLVRRSTTRRYILRVRTTHHDVQLTMPVHGSARKAHDFVQQHKDWLQSRLENLPEPSYFDDGVIIPYRGRSHVIEHHGNTKNGGVWIAPPHEIDAGSISVTDSVSASLPRILVATTKPDTCLRSVLRGWLKEEARQTFSQAAEKYAHMINVQFSRISIRDQKTRWGSCSANAALAFSWRLIMAPPYVLDYLAAHEVMHLRIMNHSPHYWSALRDICPATDRAEKWLDLHGRSLHSYEPNYMKSPAT